MSRFARPPKLSWYATLVAWAFFWGCPGPGLWAEYQSRGKRDPFIPLLTEEGDRIVPPGLDEGEASGVEALVLQGIVYDPEAESFALINGKVVQVDEEIGGAKVLSIEPSAVTVLVEEAPHRLTILKAREGETTEIPTEEEPSP